MILQIVVLILVLGIAFFHYTQGFFTAALSAICAIFAAVIALSYHETIVESFMAGGARNVAHAMVLLVLFAVVYLALRMLLDAAVPGQVRLLPLVDKIGAAVMGIIAGIFAVGIVAIAAQELPFGPSIAGYTRYDTHDDQATVPQGTGKQAATAGEYDVLKSDTPGVFDTDNRHTLYVDDWVVNIVNWLSGGGSLAGRQPLAAIHPDLLTELFGQRLGIEAGGVRVAVNSDSKQIHDVKLLGLYAIDSAVKADPEMKGWRKGFTQAQATGIEKAPPGSLLLVARVEFGRTAADIDKLVRVSPASVRLVAPTEAGGMPIDYYPLGTLQNAQTLFVNKLDDPLFLNVGDSNKAADFVFLVKRSGLLADPQKKSSMTIAPGVFIEVKRMVRMDLSGQTIHPAIDASPAVDVMRKTGVEAAPPPIAPPTVVASAPPTAAPAPMPTAPPTAAPPAPTAPNPAGHLNSPQSLVSPVGGNAMLDVTGVTQSSTLPFAIATGDQASKLSINLPGGDAILRNDRFLSLNVDVQESVDKLSAGSRPIKELMPADGQGIVVVAATVPNGTWAWADKADQFGLTDAAGTKYPPNGVWATVDDGGQKKFFARYSSNYALNSVAAQDGKVTGLWIAFDVPVGTEVNQLVLGSDKIADFPPVKVTTPP